MKTPWTKQRLDSLIGTTESQSLEFKSSKIFTFSHDKLGQELSKEVSGFANSSGGALIIGIQEGTQKPRKAESIEPFDERQWNRERLQQLVEGNLHPYLPGIRFHIIRVQPTKPEEVVCVIEVPQGTTAYQAKDFLYYGRSEYETKPLPDHEIRLRMAQGKLPQIEARLCAIKRIKSEDIFPGSNPEQWRAEVEQSLCKVPSVTPEQQASVLQVINSVLQDQTKTVYQFALEIVNEGELTVSDLLVQLTFKAKPNSGLSLLTNKNDNAKSGFEFVPMPADMCIRKEFECLKIEGLYGNKKLYPGLSASIVPETWFLRLDVEDPLPSLGAVIEWRAYLDNSPPLSGGIDVLAQIRSFLSEASDEKESTQIQSFAQLRTE